MISSTKSLTSTLPVRLLQMMREAVGLAAKGRSLRKGRWGDERTHRNSLGDDPTSLIETDRFAPQHSVYRSISRSILSPKSIANVLAPASDLIPSSRTG